MAISGIDEIEKSRRGLSITAAYVFAVVALVTSVFGILAPATISTRRSSSDAASSTACRRAAFSGDDDGSRKGGTVDQVVVILIDALRPDFAISQLASPLLLPVEDNTDPRQESRFAYTGPTLTYIEEALTGQEGDRPNMGAYFVADAPTTTSQRLRALTTGSVPAFIEARDNFFSDAVMEDSLLQQLHAQNDKCCVVLGDDTWQALYPDVWTEAHVFPSFDVGDIDTNDNSVLDELFSVLWRHAPQPRRKGLLNADEGGNTTRLVLAHFLGVDHAGHSFHARHGVMESKLAQLNKVLRNVSQTLEARSKTHPHTKTLLLVFGDHGMTNDGDHGGSSPIETDSFIFAELFQHGDIGGDSDVVKKTMTRSRIASLVDQRWKRCEGAAASAVNKLTDSEGLCRLLPHATLSGTGRTIRVSAMRQVDLVPTLSMLLGSSIPFSNTGRVAQELMSLASARAPWSHDDASHSANTSSHRYGGEEADYDEMEERIVAALRCNVHQLLTSFYNNTNTNNDLEASSLPRECTCVAYREGFVMPPFQEVDLYCADNGSTYEYAQLLETCAMSVSLQRRDASIQVHWTLALWSLTLGLMAILWVIWDLFAVHIVAVVCSLRKLHRSRPDDGRSPSSMSATTVVVLSEGAGGLLATTRSLLTWTTATFVMIVLRCAVPFSNSNIIYEDRIISTMAVLTLLLVNGCVWRRPRPPLLDDVVRYLDLGHDATREHSSSSSKKNKGLLLLSASTIVSLLVCVAVRFVYALGRRHRSHGTHVLESLPWWHRLGGSFVEGEAVAVAVVGDGEGEGGGARSAPSPSSTTMLLFVSLLLMVLCRFVATCAFILAADAAHHTPRLDVIKKVLVVSTVVLLAWYFSMCYLGVHSGFAILLLLLPRAVVFVSSATCGGPPAVAVSGGQVRLWLFVLWLSILPSVESPVYSCIILLHALICSWMVLPPGGGVGGVPPKRSPNATASQTSSSLLTIQKEEALAHGVCVAKAASTTYALTIALLLHLLTTAAFFAQGHQCSLSAVDWASSSVGTASSSSPLTSSLPESQTSFLATALTLSLIQKRDPLLAWAAPWILKQLWWKGLLVVCRTLGPLLVTMGTISAMGMVLRRHRRQHQEQSRRTSTSATTTTNYSTMSRHHQQDPSSTMLLLRSSSPEKKSLVLLDRIEAMFVLLYVALAACSAIACAVLQGHLMVVAIFGPKVVFDVAAAAVAVTLHVIGRSAAAL